MPVRPENKERYPQNWKAIRERIKQRAGNKCEKCGVPNHAIGGRAYGQFHKALPIGEYQTRLVWPKPGEQAHCEGFPERLRIIRIVCTTAHLDHIVENCDDDNLAFYCQRCHLIHDKKQHAETRYRTQREGKAVDMFDEVDQ